MRRTTQISLICSCLLAGIALGRFGLTGTALPVIVAAALVLVARRTRLALAALMLLAVALGLWRTTAWAAERGRLGALIGQTVTFTGTIADDPAVGPTGQIDFKLTDLRLASSPGTAASQPIPGTVSIHTYSIRAKRGYALSVTGKLKAGFGNQVAALSFPEYRLISTEQSWLERLRQRFFTGMRTALQEPIASFGLGLLVGIRALIPKPMQTELTLVGLSHLVAVSGYNLTIIIRAVERGLKRAGRGTMVAVSLWLIGGFLVVTGASASIVRASLVSGLSLIAGLYGRRIQPLVLILFTAGLTAIFNPVYLTDLGWLLSYLAFFGILILAPAAEARLGHPKRLITKLFIESFAAQLTTLPLILYMFGELSIVAPLTNLIILPMVPLAMATSFAAGLAGMIAPAFAGWFAWPASLVLTFMARLIDGFAALPWAGTTTTLSLPSMLAMYAVIIVLIVALGRANRRLGRRATAARLESQAG